jgi:MATE family multidrug resistance protein
MSLSASVPQSALPDAHAVSAGAELREVVRLAWPIALAHFGVIAMSLVDTAILGHVSVDDLAGAAMGRAIGFAAVTLAMGVATGLEPIAAQALGAKDPARAWQALLTTTRASLLLWVPSVIVAIGVTYLLVPLGVEASVVERTRAYVIGQAPQMALIGVFLSAKVFLQAHGSTAPALIGSAVANVLNFFVCSLLVRGDDALRAVHLPPLGLPRLGALGAGIALSFATLVLALFVLVPARRRRGHAHAPPVPMRTTWKLGLPVGAQMLAEYAVFTTIALLAGKLGKHVVSAHQIAIGLASFTYMGGLGVAGATAVRVGIAVGERRSPRRAGLMGIAVGVASMTVGAIVFAVMPYTLVDVFTDDPQVIEIGGKLLLIAAIFQLFDGVQVVAAGALRGAGDVRSPFLANIGAHWLVGFPLAVALCFGFGLGASGLWWGVTASLILTALLLGARFYVLSGRRIARV